MSKALKNRPPLFTSSWQTKGKQIKTEYLVCYTLRRDWNSVVVTTQSNASGIVIADNVITIIFLKIDWIQNTSSYVSIKQKIRASLRALILQGQPTTLATPIQW